MILIFFLMRKDLVKGRVAEDMNSSRRTGYIAGLRTFDWPGTLFFILGISLLILGLLWGGSLYRWYAMWYELKSTGKS